MKISNNSRIEWLDSSRGIAFLMVIYSHLEFCNPTLLRYFSPIYLTTFFFVSGYLFKKSSPFLRTLEQRTRTLFIPFLFYGTLLISLRQIFSFRETVVPFHESFFSMLFQYDSESRFIWFIPALYVYSLFFWVIDYFSKGNIIRLLLISVLLFFVNWILIYKVCIPKLPYTIHHAGFGCAYMGLGQIYRNYENKLNHLFNIKHFIFCLFLYLIVVSCLPSISYAGSQMGVDSLIITCIGLYIIVYVSKRSYAHDRLILFIGSNSLLYFCLHGKAYALLQSVALKLVPVAFLNNSLISFVLGLFITFLVAIILVIPIILINRYVAFSIGKNYILWKT